MIKLYLFVIFLQMFNGLGPDQALPGARPADSERPFNFMEARAYVQTMSRVIPVLGDQEKTLAVFSSSGIDPERFQVIARRFDVAWAFWNQKIDWAELSAWPPGRRPTLAEIAAAAILFEPFRQVEEEINQKVYFPSKNASQPEE